MRPLGDRAMTDGLEPTLTEQLGGGADERVPPPLSLRRRR